MAVGPHDDQFISEHLIVQRFHKRMATYKLTIEYEGTRYSGWQAQGNTPKTIQGRLLKAASEVFGDVDIGGAGRTDAGVHAAGQVAHLRVHKAADPVHMMRKMNDLLPHDINVIDCVRASDRFHARHDATSRVYLYQIATVRTAFAKPFVWWVKDTLDFDRMSAAAAQFVGKHDFTVFSDKRLKDDESRLVVVESVDLARDEGLILFRIAASHFLWKMVRKLVAFLVEVGRGNLRQQPKERFQPTAPPSGLFLEAITYDGRFERPLRAIVPVRR